MGKHIGYIKLPVYELGERELAGLRMDMLTAGPHSVATGTGLGSDAIYVALERDGEHTYRYVTGRDALVAVAELTCHPDADRLTPSASYAKQPPTRHTFKRLYEALEDLYYGEPPAHPHGDELASHEQNRDKAKALLDELESYAKQA